MLFRKLLLGFCLFTVLGLALPVWAGGPVSPSPTPGVLSGWGYYDAGYHALLPPGWTGKPQGKNRWIFSSGRAGGGLEEITVEIIPDAPGIPFAGGEEFGEWRSGSRLLQGTVRKIDNVTAGGLPGVLLSDVGTGPSEWKLLAWLRQDFLNYHIVFKGAGRQGAGGAEAVDYFLSNFIPAP